MKKSKRTNKAKSIVMQPLFRQRVATSKVAYSRKDKLLSCQAQD